MKRFLKKLLGLKIILLIKDRFRSKNEIELIKKRRLFYKQFLRHKGDIFFDVGANDGNRIEPLINQGYKIIGVEPQEDCIKFLKAKFGDKIILVPKGLGKIVEKRTMHIAYNNVLSSFSEDFINATNASGRFKEYNWKGKQEVEITTLDILIAEYGKPKFIKIDVEGFEYEVLNGLSEPIENISFEYTIPERKQCLLNCIDRIVELSGQNQVKFNYSIGESMEWALENWLLPNQMKVEVESKRFVQSQFGDVYSKIELS